jgi:hypothetical protein
VRAVGILILVLAKMVVVVASMGTAGRTAHRIGRARSRQRSRDGGRGGCVDGEEGGGDGGVGAQDGDGL